MATFQSTLDEDDEDLPPELVPPLIIYVKIGSCSVDPFTLVAAQIRSGPLFLSEDMRDESEAIGKADLPTSLLSFDATVELINGVVDFLLASVPPKYSRFVLQNPVGALANRSARRRPLTPAIFEAKKDNLPAALPQAAMAVASYRKQHELPVLRGCITSGEQLGFLLLQGSGDMYCGSNQFGRQLGKPLTCSRPFKGFG
ncbi:hypothetical protein AX14_007280 [Amanita brunnescens Koide BX004]|nr:hypothetical protein AX14_007280 [Amanita brunnescens Koide BX004]